MKYALFLIGEALNGDASMQRYIERHLAAVGIRHDHLFRCDRAEPPFTDLLRCTTEERTIFVFCDPDMESLIAREITTLTEDTITMRNDLLLPSRALSLKTGYYKVVDTPSEIHVITVYTGHELPEPDLRRGADRAETHLFNVDKNALQPVLKQLSDAYRIRCALSEPIPGWLQCRMEAERFGDIEGAQQQLLSQFPTGIGADNIAAWLIEALESAGRTVTFAESCTGGLLSYYLTKEHGASGVFEGALVTYSNRLKSSWIAVENATLETYGAVSREVVEEMSTGALEVSGADYALAVSGVAGPTGGTPQKPVGTVQIAVRSKEALLTECLHLHGDRNYIQEQTVLHAVKMLLSLDKKTFFKISG